MGAGDNSGRALLFAPLGRDAEVAGLLLRDAGVGSLACGHVAQLCREMESGAAVAVLTEEALAISDTRELGAWVKAQPAWSDFPFILLTGRGDAPGRSPLAQVVQDLLGNVTFLERPFHPTTFVNVARSALRARRRQYEAGAVLDRQLLLARELQHRTKNLLAVIQSIASGSFRSGDVQDKETFRARLHALANAQNILVETEWQGAPIRDLIEAALGGLGSRVSMAGPHVFVKPSVAQGFALIIHELATNAAKHGAFSTQNGAVSVRWSREGDSAEPILYFRWQERGGPRVTPPKRKGFGSVLLQHAVAHTDTPPRLDFAPEGLTYELKASLALLPAYRFLAPCVTCDSA